MGALTDELRRRLDVPADLVPDATLDRFILVAGNALAPWLVADPTPWPDNVDEGTLQLAVKLYDTAGRGITSMDGAGEWAAPAPAASPGLIRSVFGALGPALSAGGVSV